MTVMDIRHKTPRSNNTRKESSITKIARHHSATTDGNWDAFWKHWNGTRGWGTGGYHEIILRNGDVELCYDPNEITNGVKGHNSTTYNICMVGNGSFTDAQEKAFDERAKLAMQRFNLQANDVLGHNEFSGQSTSCPGINMNTVRSRLGTVVQVSNPTVNPTPKPTGNLAVDGYLGKLTISALQRYFGTPVDGIISKPSTVIKALQKLLGVNADGYMGPITITAMQRRFGTPIDGKISRPSPMVKELQRRLNNGKL